MSFLRLKLELKRERKKKSHPVRPWGGEKTKRSNHGPDTSLNSHRKGLIEDLARTTTKKSVDFLTINKLNGSQQAMNTPTTASIILIICKEKNVWNYYHVNWKTKTRVIGNKLHGRLKRIVKYVRVEFRHESVDGSSEKITLMMVFNSTSHYLLCSKVYDEDFLFAHSNIIDYNMFSRVASQRFAFWELPACSSFAYELISFSSFANKCSHSLR